MCPSVSPTELHPSQLGPRGQQPVCPEGGVKNTTDQTWPSTGQTRARRCGSSHRHRRPCRGPGRVSTFSSLLSRQMEAILRDPETSQKVEPL